MKFIIHVLRMSVFSTFAIFGLSISTQAQAPSFANKKIGVYISSKEFNYPPEYYIQVSQFLKQEDDRSAAGRMKAELIIKLGWLLTEQLQTITGADTVYFMNADLALGRGLQDAYEKTYGRLRQPSEELKTLDVIWVVDPFELSNRIHKSVYIHSNRMITERIPIKKVNFFVRQFNMDDPTRALVDEVCFDAKTSPSAPAHFDFYESESPLGKFFSRAFSQWWAQVQGTSTGLCEE